MNRRKFIKLVGLYGVYLGVGSVKTTFPIKDIINLESEVKKTNPFRLDSKYNYSDDELEKYNTWIDKTLMNSKRNKNHSVIIDKASYTLNLIENGKLHSHYPIELGFNPHNDKKIEGDGCTPEGLYEVIVKKDKGQTSFYRAFLINYPNKEDWKEFYQLKEKGAISPKDKIGGEIEIHGSGSGKQGNKGGHNWTLGCIALSNDDIDKIFPFVTRGTKVTIVKYTTLNI